MECPKCKFQNPEEMQFCGKCGSKLANICSKCGFENPDNFSFCGKCGQNFGTLSERKSASQSFEEKLDKIQRFLPKGITKKILSQKDKIEGEKRQVTVMFCDMKGFTPIVETLGPEKAYFIMDEIYEILIHKVHDYDGTVNEMTGDGIMALFGAPIALEDAPQRAIRSSLAIHKEITKFSNVLKQKQKDFPIIKMRVGIHSGPVVVGSLGNTLRVEFKAVGDTVNLASRMEGLAEPGTTYVTEDTFRLTEGFFRFEALGKIEVKGKKDKVRSFRVIAANSRRTRFDVSAERGLTPFIGKKKELENMLDGFESSKSGRGRAFSIVAEAGVGKSRLLYEFRKAVANENVTFLEGKCLSYGQNLAYHPIIDILKSMFGIEDDGDKEIRQKVTNSLSLLGMGGSFVLPYILELMSVNDSGINQIDMSPDGKKAQIIESIKRIALKGTEIRPLIMVIEDLHWIDKSSEDVLRDFLSSIPGAQILLILTYRPEYLPPWSGKSYHSQMNLYRFSNRESLSMMCYLLDMDNVPLDFEELVLEKTEGNPFYIEEFIKSLQELNICEKNDLSSIAKGNHSVTIPSTIQDVIMSRVDRLPEKAKQILLSGAVIEREFGHELLKEVMNIPEQELLKNIDILKNSELLYERGIFPESTYIFKHALTRDVIYDSILTEKKKALHETIGNVIERLYKEGISEFYGILSDHFLKSDNYEKSIAYSEKAGKAAQKKNAFIDAIYYAKKRADCLEKLPQTDEIQKKFIDAKTTLSNYYLSLNRHSEAMDAVFPIEGLAEEIDYQKRFPRILVAKGTCQIHVKEEFSKGMEDLKKAIVISEQVNDFLSLWNSYYHMGSVLCLECEFENSLDYFNKALDLSVAANSFIGTISVKTSMAWFNYTLQGKIGIAFETSKELLPLIKESNDVYIRAVALCGYGSACYYKGVFNEAESNLLQAVAFCEKISFLSWGAWALANLGNLYCEKGNFEKAKSYYNKSMLFLKSASFQPSTMRLLLLLLHVAKTRVLKKNTDANMNILYDYAHANRIKIFDGWCSRAIGEILMNIDSQDQSKAEGWIKKALEIDNKRGLSWQLAMDHVVYSDLFKKNGSVIKAIENLCIAIDIFKGCGADGWAEKIEKRLVKL